MSNRILCSHWDSKEGRMNRTYEQDVIARAHALATALYERVALDWKDTAAYIDPDTIRKALGIRVFGLPAVYEAPDGWNIAGGPPSMTLRALFGSPLIVHAETNEIAANDYFAEANRLTRVAEIGRAVAQYAGDKELLPAAGDDVGSSTSHYAESLCGHLFAERLAGRQLTRAQTWTDRAGRKKWVLCRDLWLRAWIRENPSTWLEVKAVHAAQEAQSRADWFPYHQIKRERDDEAAQKYIVEILSRSRRLAANETPAMLRSA